MLTLLKSSNMKNLEITYLSVNTLVDYKSNAKTHSPEQVEAIANSIVEFGFNNPILIDEVGEIIAGHGRVLGAKLAGMDQVPCIVLEDLSEVQKKAYRIADNKIHELGGWDLEKLSLELNAINDEGFDLDLTGFDPDELNRLLAESGEDANYSSEGLLFDEEDNNDSKSDSEEKLDQRQRFAFLVSTQEAGTVLNALKKAMGDNYLNSYDEAFIEIIRIYNKYADE